MHAKDMFQYMVTFLENSEMVGFPTSKILGDLTQNDPKHNCENYRHNGIMYLSLFKKCSVGLESLQNACMSGILLVLQSRQHVLQVSRHLLTSFHFCLRIQHQRLELLQLLCLNVNDTIAHMLRCLVYAQHALAAHWNLCTKQRIFQQQVNYDKVIMTFTTTKEGRI